MILTSLVWTITVTRDLFPYWKFENFDLASWNHEECIIELRFAMKDLQLLMNYLEIPEKIFCFQGTVRTEIEGLCILLKRLAYPCRYSDMESCFGRNTSSLCPRADPAHRLTDA